jgi:rubrerythrin
MRAQQKEPRPWECTVCGYNLTGNVSGVCPECGNAIAKVE